MSHFTVLVIGNDVDKILAPYHEFECTGREDYIQNIDITDEIKEDYNKNKKDYASISDFAKDYYGISIIGEKDIPDIADKKGQKYGWCRINSNGELIEAIKRTNPNKQWDYYEISGRWGNILQLKDGEKVNQSRAADVDWDSMRVKNRNDANEKYTLAYHHCRFSSLKDEFISFEKCKAETNDIEEAREKYHSQELIEEFKKLKNSFDIYDIFENIEEYFIDKETYLENAYNAPLTFALVDENGWQERGHMGWWGIVSDEKESGEASKNYYDTIDKIKNSDILVTVVDCHI